MRAVITADNDIAEWNALVNRDDTPSLLQSSDWGDAKAELGWEVIRVAVSHEGAFVAGAQVLVRRLPLGVGSVAYVPHGPVGRWHDQDVAPMLFDAVHAIARKSRAVFLKVEPATPDRPEVRDQLGQLGFRESTFSNQPLATIVMNIDDDPETILRGMRDSTRRKIGSAQRKGVTVRRGDVNDLGTFYDLMSSTAARTGATLRSFEYYETEYRTFDAKNRAVLLLASHEGEVLAAHIAYAHGEHAAFFHQASSGRRSNLNPNVLLVWEQVKWAKSNGCRTHDLWGIPDEIGRLVSKGEELPLDRTDGLWGVYRFKSGFSRNIVSRVGSFDYVYSPAAYKLMASPNVNGVIERVSSRMDMHGRRRSKAVRDRRGLGPGGSN
jgi:lipid II:glycine glycyltransferase (peptidoglycan interpeptide bridge formation enzyme)